MREIHHPPRRARGETADGVIVPNTLLAVVSATRRSSPFMAISSLHPLLCAPRLASRPTSSRRSRQACLAANDDALSSFDSGLLVVGAVATPVVLFSEWTLSQTGCGLPPGPGGLYGAAEGLSYLAVVGFAAASVHRKVTTGTGLPAGPGGALGAVEGLVYLSILAGLLVAGQQLITVGGLPSPLPDDKCFG